ncbi:UDP-N-acetylglucosamine 2-epimerase (non-hydrolysing) [Aquimarina sp. MAR_2010_214]|uniref:non-hydrolyzing UDP-N-acetylglucosamine 2-epimerase n=1 Tax=Aquimarina sp. MAR_2010_214 TaxID=1250026 RepID=UPI000C71277E|nr:UDP-N-acetylglucosamine 2-epimerase (non-hydrolyzing) [Aquimarina sp. MAR_2010_214]PKV50979.1 UDP-N-acetylglucosamine 2-epimerase (non-hydrolysing) [Aquimarina sp. MAR_2010_214]
MRKVLLIFGTRPEAIKMAPLVKEFKKYPKKFETKICVTAQHREMLDQVLSLFDIKPDFDLDLMKKGQDLYDITSRVLLGLRGVLEAENPDVILVHGDTTTSTAASMAAFYQKIKVGHIEAGLRTRNIYSPWPEEMNRQITGRIATYHFSPTKLSKKNLLDESINEDQIIVTGNTVIDALHLVLDQIRKNTNIQNDVFSSLVNVGISESKLESWISSERKLVLITGHRRENFGQGFENICLGIKKLAEKYPEVDFLYPMHLNPNVRKPISEVFLENELNNVVFVEPLEYLPFVYLMSKSYLVLTDSGGIQEEAPGIGKPVLVMRNTTERPEGLEAGTVKLVGTDKDLIINEVSSLIDSKELYLKMSEASNPYGDGFASKRIVEYFMNTL